MKILALGDLHLPWIDWRAMAVVAKFAERYQPDLIVQVGDFIDAQAWSRHPKNTDAPPADDEWDQVVAAAKKLHAILPAVPLYIIEGNHDRRHKMRALDAMIPSQLVRPLSSMFPYENWTWHVKQQPLTFDGVDYIHGDELNGNAHQKASRCGRSIVQGHLHSDAGIKYISAFGRETFGCDIGTLMDLRSIAARYANKRLIRSWIGWATIEDGTPHLHPYRSRRSSRGKRRHGHGDDSGPR